MHHHYHRVVYIIIARFIHDKTYRLHFDTSSIDDRDTTPCHPPNTNKTPFVPFSPSPFPRKRNEKREREREKLENRSRGHRTSNNRAMFKAAGRVDGKTARLFPSEIAFSPKQLFRTFVAWRITKKEEKKNSPLVRDKYADAQRKSCTTPSPSDGIQFGIRYKQRRRRRSRSSFVQRRQTKRNSPKRGLTRRE